MSESDQTPHDEPHPSWPQYSWHAEGDTPPASTPPAPAVSPDPLTVSWPPTQPNPAPAGPAQANPAEPFFAPANPTQPNAPYGADPNAPGLYAHGQNAGGGAWAPPPPAWGPPSGHAWPPAPARAPQPRARRGLAALAALALVLASAGVGAGVAIAVHDHSSPRSFDSAGSNSFGNTNPNNGGFGNGGFGNGGTNNNGGTNGTVPSGSGTLDMNAIAAKVDPALVDINTTLAQGRAAGTGMLISSDGEILTNNHVIADATSIKVTVDGGTGATYNAKVVGYDVTEDVALVKITDKVSNLPTVTFGDPSKVNVGDPVVALGNAGGRGGAPAVSQGQITALDQEVTAGDPGGTQETLEGMIQINAPIQPGDSGGALVDRGGKIIGMNTAAAGSTGQFSQTPSNIGFSIPIDHAVGIVSVIRAGNDTDKVHIGDRALLGVDVQDVQAGAGPVSSGAAVVGVQANTGADSAGIQTGDTLTSLDGKSIADSAALRLALVKFHPGDSVSVGWVDASGAQHNANVKLVVGPPL